jgi:tyrosyl-tRNA synthetase
MKLSEELKWRGFVNQTTFDNLSKLDDEKWIFYHGYDASADSLTIGNLAAVMLDKVLVRHGHKAIILAGGATSLIGDPGGKDSERTLQSEEAVRSNVRKVNAQLEKLFGSRVHFVNNLDWYKNMNVLEFLRDVGKHFSMTPLVQRDYIAKRMGQGGSGISYTEFTYTLLQGYDFLHLYKKYGVELQLSGSDQWGNAISGVELVRRVEGKEVHALTMPLILNKATGKKFGKSEAGAVWLDPHKTSPDQFYQFWINVDDEGTEDYLKIFTELDKEAIDKVMAEFQENRSKRAAQKKLAYEVTRLVHGKEAAEKAVKSAEGLKQATITGTASIVKGVEVTVNASIIDALVDSGLTSSKTEARKLLASGGVYINDQQTNKENLDESDFVDGMLRLRRGKTLQNTRILKRK